jgi:hypothetical protein
MRGSQINSAESVSFLKTKMKKNYHYLHSLPLMKVKKETNNCSTLPHPIIYSINKTESIKGKLIQLLLTTPTYQLEQFHSVLSLLHLKQQEQACFELILDILREYTHDKPLDSNDVDRILLLFELCPNACTLKDESGLLVIHHLCLMDELNHSLIHKCIELFPQSISNYALFGYIEATPLHLLLLKSDPDYELTVFMVEKDPLSAK